MIVVARVGRGDVEVLSYEPGRSASWSRLAPIPPLGALDVGPLTLIADFVAVTDDGWIVLADGSAVIDADDQLVVGESIVDDTGVTFIPSAFGDFQLLPRSLLITPTGEVLDLQAIRAGLSPAPSAPPVTTIQDDHHCVPRPRRPCLAARSLALARSHRRHGGTAT